MNGDSRGEPGPLADRLRRAVFEVHRRIESLPFFASLSRRDLPLERYVDQLRAMAIVHAGLERTLGASDDPAVRTAWAAATPRLGLLLADLAFFDARGPLADAPASTTAALASARRALLASNRPPRLLGHLYVLQGMALGNATHLGDARAVAGGTPGTAWYEGLGSGTGARWQAFCRVLETLELRPEDGTEAVAGALEAVTAQEVIHATLDPALPVARRVLATTLNVEAGTHAVPEDPALLAAALRAGERCLEEFPYFSERWGERGRRYTRSDVAWLVTLAGLEPAEALGEVRWLGGVLARRGMPTLLLERQLELLAAELPGASGSPSALFLRSAAADLRARRARVLPEESAARLSARFEGATAFATPGARRAAALLLLAAVADEAGGLPGSLDAAASWFRGERFPDEWRHAVETLLREAGAAAQAP